MCGPRLKLRSQDGGKVDLSYPSPIGGNGEQAGMGKINDMPVNVANPGWKVGLLKALIVIDMIFHLKTQVAHGLTSLSHLLSLYLPSDYLLKGCDHT